jgi:hypothetical protein
MIAYQLYSSRNFPPLDATAKMLASVGLTGTEGFGGLYDTPATLAATASALKAAGLSMKTGHFGLSQVEDTPLGRWKWPRPWGLNVFMCLT